MMVIITLTLPVNLRKHWNDCHRSHQKVPVSLKCGRMSSALFKLDSAEAFKSRPCCERYWKITSTALENQQAGGFHHSASLPGRTYNACLPEGPGHPHPGRNFPPSENAYIYSGSCSKAPEGRFLSFHFTFHHVKRQNLFKIGIFLISDPHLSTRKS